MQQRLTQFCPRLPVKPDTFSLKHASDGLICLQVYTHIQVMCNRTVTCIKQACAFHEREVPQFPCRPNRLPPRPDVQSYRAMENKAYYACSCLLHTPCLLVSLFVLSCAQEMCQCIIVGKILGPSNWRLLSFFK